MGSKSERVSSDHLNQTLKYIVSLLQKNNVKDWFISYGTLLGIIRENSCIQNDDDVDIIINISNYTLIETMLNDNNIKIWGRDYKPNRKVGKTNKIIKTKSSPELASIDFYFCEVDDNGTFLDSWNSVVWNDCYVDGTNLISKEWNGVVLNIPHNAENKLEARYGNWRVYSKHKTGGNSTRNLP